MQVFPGESELARRMRELDWTSTPLGDPATWPENLRVALSICLSSPAPKQLWWGRELTLLYNDAASTLLGPRHPEVLGTPAPAAWGVRWARVAPSVERVLAQAEPLALADDSLTLCPIPGASGVEGIVCMLRDEALAMIAHELRNPLVPMLTALHTIRDTGRAMPEMLDMLETQIGHITRLLDALGGRKGRVEPSPSQTKLRVLVVDDNRAAAKALQLGLGLLGCDVSIAHDATAALALAQQALPDVAVLDLELVGESGRDLGTRLRAMGPVALIALTGYGSEMARARTRAAGFVHHLLKPADLKLLHRAIVNAAGGGAAPDR